MVSLDSAEKNQAFAESLDANFPLLSDPDKQVARAYGVLGALRLFAKRKTFYIDPQGVIRHLEEDVDTADPRRADRPHPDRPRLSAGARGARYRRG